MTAFRRGRGVGYIINGEVGSIINGEAGTFGNFWDLVTDEDFLQLLLSRLAKKNNILYFNNSRTNGLLAY